MHCICIRISMNTFCNKNVLFIYLSLLVSIRWHTNVTHGDAY